ncbi:MAG: zf-HC2 domain-containing protein [Candidatus Zixiibacteriota bacterium]|nr:MAG: zf-HC2 domain-containing protein [candidate division Zixibacteria bacterium]
MNCNEFKSMIDSFLDGELDEKETTEFEIHFTSCNKCHIELESVDKCSKVLRKLLKSENPPQSIKDRVFREFEQDK